MLATIFCIKGFLEPVKGSRVPVQSSTQAKRASHQSTHPEIGLPDLSVSWPTFRLCQWEHCASLFLFNKIIYNRESFYLRVEFISIQEVFRTQEKYIEKPRA